MTATVEVPVHRLEAGRLRPSRDTVAVEEPLEIRLGYGPVEARSRLSVSLTMRTPGEDRELAAGFLFAESVLPSLEALLEIRDAERLSGEKRNVVWVELRPGAEPDVAGLARYFAVSSSCGVCGKTSLGAIETRTDRPPLGPGFQVPVDALLRLPAQLLERQASFGSTGGVHAAALFDPTGALGDLREDVGRHNALDKLIGAQFLLDNVPLERHGLLLSGRASFELLQKAFMAAIPVVAAIGAPSSLAVELADRFGITLVGWLRGDRFTIFTHPERIASASWAG